MNKEIKINRINKSITFINGSIVTSQFCIADEVLDLIEDLQKRIDKAIEYIENNPLYSEVYDYDYEENLQCQGACDYEAREDLLKILNGSDKE